MAYPAVVSLKQTIHHLLNSPHILILPPSFLQIIQTAHKEVQSLQDFLLKPDKISRSEHLDGQIRVAACKLEDVIESHMSDQFISQYERLRSPILPLVLQDLHNVNRDIDLFTETVNKLKEVYVINEPRGSLRVAEDDLVPSTIGGKMVGFSNEFLHIKDNILLQDWDVSIRVVSLVGMAGIGKTTLAREIFGDPSVSEWFELRVWVTVGQNHELKQLMQRILAQVDPGNKKAHAEMEWRLDKRLFNSLEGRRFLIVLDDVWNGNVWHDLKRKLPDDLNGSRFLLTTRLEEAALWYTKYQVRFLNEEESWDLLREKVFGDEPCPSKLKKAGKRIAEYCEGLPLTIVTVADLLSEVEKTPEYWNEVANNKNSIFMKAYDRIEKVLLPSYNYLPQHLKPCFLYMGVFPQKYEIPTPKLIKLWSSEGFLEQHMFQHSGIDNLLEALVSSHVLIDSGEKISSPGIKTCRLHTSFWHLCKREAERNKFFCVITSCAEGFAEGIKSQRRLCIHNNILFGIKGVYNSMASVSSIRSLLCTGPFHQYPVTLHFDCLKLLRVLDALTLRFYEFPVEVLELVQLRYLALTSNGNLPSSISKLWRLQYLIVGRHLNIKYYGVQSYLPTEIWDMKELTHLEIPGCDLPDPRGSSLPNLLKLSGVSAHSCTEGVLRGLPNLKKLGIWIELAPCAAEPLTCFDYVYELNDLESFKCTIVNPVLSVYETDLRPHPLTILESCLEKLSLSGLGCKWEDIRTIALLPNLQVLKLRCYAFRGPKWETCDGGFSMLQSLVIEDSDLVHWTIGRQCFPCLKWLSLKNCYKLEEIPPKFGESLSIIEVIECNPLTVACAKQMQEDRLKKFKFYTIDTYLHVNVSSSWDDKELKS